MFSQRQRCLTMLGVFVCVAAAPSCGSDALEPVVQQAGSGGSEAGTPSDSSAGGAGGTSDSSSESKGGASGQADASGQGGAAGKAGDGGTGNAAGSGTGGNPPDGGTIPLHIETWAYDTANHHATEATPELVAKWVTYAETFVGDKKALQDCRSIPNGCKVIVYVNASRFFSNGGSFAVDKDAQEDWWLHEPGYSDAAHRLRKDFAGPPAYFANYLNQSVVGVQNWYRDYLREHADEVDGLMVDETFPSLSAVTVGTGVASTQEITTDDQVIAMHVELAKALTHKDGTPFLQIDNTLNPNPWLSQGLELIHNPPQVLGLVAESFPLNDKLPPTPYYADLLDSIAGVAATGGFLVLLSYATGGPPAARRLHSATVLLGYSPGHIVSWALLERESTTQLNVWPEQGIYPTQPVQTMTKPTGTGCLGGVGEHCKAGGHFDLQVAPGVFRREFTACFNQSVPFGRCAVLTNSTENDVVVAASWLSASYAHQITLVGGDVQSGGTVDLAGAAFAPGLTIPARDALLLSE